VDRLVIDGRSRSSSILIAGFVGWWYLGKINPEGAPGDVQSFTVNEDDDLETIAQRLADDGLISDPGSSSGTSNARADSS
jgi:hypothetical protein